MGKRWHDAWLRHPKTTQELRVNQDRNDPYVRAKRRNLPTAWDDSYVRKQKSWKYLGRKHQYRGNVNYGWHEYHYSGCWKHNIPEYMVAQNIMKKLDILGCYYKRTSEGVRWYGPAWWNNGECPHCHGDLISDSLSPLYGDWCPNEDCSYSGD